MTFSNLPAGRSIGIKTMLITTILLILLASFSGAFNKDAFNIMFYCAFALTVLMHYGVVIGLSFESFRRYSRFGMSHNRKILNQLLSIALVALPFLAAFTMPLLIVPALILMAISKFRSPDAPGDKALSWFRRQGSVDIFKILLWVFMVAALTLNFVIYEGKRSDAWNVIEQEDRLLDGIL